MLLREWRKEQSPGVNRCPLCGGTKKSGKTTFTADMGFGVVVVRGVPATICFLNHSLDLVYQI